jgi:RNA polymerase sigma factor (sigma-70 family)
MAAENAHVVLRHIRQVVASHDARQQVDRELIERFVTRHDSAAFEELVERHGSMVLRACQRVLRDRHAAEDAFQATFLLLARKAGSIGRRELLANWLYGVAYRIAAHSKVDDAKRRNREARAETTPPTDPLTEITGRELCAVLDEELHRLPPRIRMPFLLCYVEGRTRDQAAAQMGCSLRTLHRRLESGRRLLQARLTRRGITLSAALVAAGLGQQGASAAVPALLVVSAVKAAMVAGEQSVASGVVSARALAMAEGMLKGMTMTKLKVAALLVFVLSLVGGGASVLARHALAPEQQTAKSADPVDQRAENQPKLAEDNSPPTDRHGDALPDGALARMGTTRLRHGGAVYSVAYSPDGKLLASGSAHQTIRLWDAVTRKEIRQLKGSHNGTCNVAFSPDDKTLASAEPDNALCLWDVSTGKRLGRFRGHQAIVRAIAFAPDGKTLASSSGDQTLRLWDTTTRKELRQCEGTPGDMHAVAFAPDGKTLAAGGEDGVVRLWETATGKDLQQLRGHREQIYAIAFSPDGKLLASGGRDYTIRLWDPATGKELRQLRSPTLGHAISGLAFARDSSTLAASSWDKTVRLWDVAADKETILRHREWVSPVVFSPDGKTVACGSGDSQVHLWDVATGTELRQAEEHGAGVRSVAFSPDGHALVSGSHDGTVRLWGVATGIERRKLLRQDASVPSVAFGPRGEVAAAVAGGAIRLWDPATGKELRNLSANDHSSTCVVFSHNGKVLATGALAADRVTGAITLWDVATGGQIRQLKKPRDYIRSLAFSPDDKILASAGSGLGDDTGNGVVRLWETATGEELRELKGHRQEVFALAFTPDGATLATAANGDRTIRLWDVATGKERGQIKADANSVHSLAFSPDGKQLAGDVNLTVTLWDVATGKTVRQFSGHRDYIECVAFSPDGKLLASGSWDSTILVWDVSGRPERGKLPPRLTPEELEKLWQDLADADASRATTAFRTLAAVPRQTVPFLETCLREAERNGARRTARLIAELDDDTFEVREKATAELERLGTLVESALREALSRSPSPEARRRMEKILEKLKGAEENPPRRPPTVRVVELLERIGSTEARQVLESVARGVPETELEQEAKAALRRLDKRSEKER